MPPADGLSSPARSHYQAKGEWLHRDVTRQIPDARRIDVPRPRRAQDAVQQTRRITGERIIAVVELVRPSSSATDTARWAPGVHDGKGSSPDARSS